MKVIDGPPQSEVMIIVAATDAKDQRWESRNVFRTDPTGTIDISRDAPASGSYGSVDPAGPIWSMRFASEDLAPTMFAAPRDQLEFTFTAEAGGETASGVAVRRWSGPGVTRSEIRGTGSSGSCSNRPEMARTRRSRLSQEQPASNRWSPEPRCWLHAGMRR